MSCYRTSMKVTFFVVPPQRGRRSRFKLVDALDQHGPAVTPESSRRRDGRLFLIGCAVPKLVQVEPGLGRCGLFGSDAGGLIHPYLGLGLGLLLLTMFAITDQLWMWILGGVLLGAGALQLFASWAG